MVPEQEEDRVTCISIEMENSDEGTTESDELPAYLQDLWERYKPNLTKAEQKSIQRLLLKHSYYSPISKNKQDLGRTQIQKGIIETGIAPPVKMPACRFPIHQREEEQKHIDAMLEQNIIEHSNSSWRSSVVLVRKKDGSYCWCVDFLSVNAVTRKDSYPLPQIDDTLDRLSGSKWFSTLDLQSGYWQVKLDEESHDKTSFLTNFGIYKF